MWRGRQLQDIKTNQNHPSGVGESQLQMQSTGWGGVEGSSGKVRPGQASELSSNKTAKQAAERVNKFRIRRHQFGISSPSLPTNCSTESGAGESSTSTSTTVPHATRLYL
jgi:hypothetical protein